MATREHMASAQDTIADNGQERLDAAADRVVAKTASVPWAPAGVAYAHQDEAHADSEDMNDGQDDDETAHPGTPASRPSPPRLRRAIPLLWAAALTVAALQHAGEVERRMGLREPTSSELDMRDRSAQDIKAAWRSIGTVTVTAEKPIAEKTEPVIAQPQLEQAAARDIQDRPQEIKPQETARLLVEPITEAVRERASFKGTEESTREAAQQPVQDTNIAAATTEASEEHAKIEAVQATPPVATTNEQAKLKHKGRATTSRASQPHAGRAEAARPKRTRTSSSQYVPFDGHTPRYFTIEQPARMAP